MSLVVLEMLNCEDFSRVFRDLGVKDVISFKIQNLTEYKKSNTLKEFSSEDNQNIVFMNFINNASKFMQAFIINFYQYLLDNKTIQTAKNLAE